MENTTSSWHIRIFAVDTNTTLVNREPNMKLPKEHTNMRKILIFLVLAIQAAAFGAGQISNNLLPNGDAENEFLNMLAEDGGFATKITGKDTLVPTYWQPSNNVRLDKETRYEGNSTIRLMGGKDAVSATVFSDYWKIKDSSMPFGLPLLPDRDVTLSFAYKTSALPKNDLFKVHIKLGTIANLPSEEQEIQLPPSSDWKQINTTLKPKELLWGAQVSFALGADAGDEATVWIDSVHLTQDIDCPANLAHNPGFERSTETDGLPMDWQQPLEDQWVSWIGNQYRPPQLDLTCAASGRYSLRSTVTYADVSGISQTVHLHQDQARPVFISICSKLENSIGNHPPGYYGSDNLPNLTVFIYHTDGTMQEVSPTLCLGESDHDWDYRRFGFLPQKPVEKMRVQVTLVGTEPTTSLWIDDLTVFEIADNPGALCSAAFAEQRTITGVWGKADELSDTNSEQILSVNNAECLGFSIPIQDDAEEVFVYLNKDVHTDFVNHKKYLYNVIKITPENCQIGTVAEKQGYIANGLFEDAQSADITLQRTAKTYLLSIPFRVLGMDGPSQTPIGFNVEWKKPDGSTSSKFWTGNAINTDQLGFLVSAPEPSVSIRSLRFGDRYDTETDQSQDLITHPPIFAGKNTAELCLRNPGEATNVEITAGVEGQPQYKGTHHLGANETKTIAIPYDTKPDLETVFTVSLQTGVNDPVCTSFPLVVPPAIEIVLDQEYHFPEEETGQVTIYNRYRPVPSQGYAVLEIEDLVEGKTVYESKETIGAPTAAIQFPVESLRINDLPVQDYQARVSYYADEITLLGSRTARFGRIKRTERQVLPPIEKLEIDDTGRVIINGDFRFFPIVPSVSRMDWHDAIDLGANIFRGYFRAAKEDEDGNIDSSLEDTIKAWSLGAYSLTIGPGPTVMDDFKKEGPELLSHPAFFSCYAKQFYYWNLTQELTDYRKDVEQVMGEQPIPKLTIWGHHDSSFLYDIDSPEWPIKNPPVGYCYVHIMGRPGSGWRNSPFLTLTEQVLDSHKFKLAEVNHYVSYHDDEIVPEHFSTFLSIRGDDWWGMRNESYLSVIYGANGLYHYVCVQKGGLQQLRGWFQELNYMWPIFVADDAPATVQVTPAGSGIETRLKKHEGKYYLLTANASEAPQDAEIKISGLGNFKVRKLFNLPGAMQTDSSTITDTWKKYDSFVYEITTGE